MQLLSVLILITALFSVGRHQDVPPDCNEFFFTTTTDTSSTETSTSPRHEQNSKNSYKEALGGMDLCEYVLSNQRICHRCCRDSAMSYRCCRTFTVLCAHKYGL